MFAPRQTSPFVLIDSTQAAQLIGRTAGSYLRLNGRALSKGTSLQAPIHMSLTFVSSYLCALLTMDHPH